MDAFYHRRIFDHGPVELAYSLIVVAAVVVLDQGSKAAAFDTSRQQFGTARNVGFLLGIGGGSQVPLIMVSLAVLGAFAFAAARFMISIGGWTLGPMLVVGGAGSNLLDRIRLGGVRDFLTVGRFIVNEADFAVAAGLVLTCVALGLVAYRLHTNGRAVRFDRRHLRLLVCERD